MELWIRSQDKTGITKINKNIGLKYNDNKTIIADYIPDFSDNYDGSYNILGTYKTKERALEILNEIQNILFPEDMIDELEALYTNLIIRNKDCDSYVYEMPEE